jgi:hypothetical protein
LAQFIRIFQHLLLQVFWKQGNQFPHTIGYQAHSNMILPYFVECFASLFNSYQWAGNIDDANRANQSSYSPLSWSFPPLREGTKLRARSVPPCLHGEP